MNPRQDLKCHAETGLNYLASGHALLKLYLCEDENHHISFLILSPGPHEKTINVFHEQK